MSRIVNIASVRKMLTKKQKLMYVGVLILVLMIVGIGIWYFLIFNKPSTTNNIQESDNERLQRMSAEYTQNNTVINGELVSYDDSKRSIVIRIADGHENTYKLADGSIASRGISYDRVFLEEVSIGTALSLTYDNQNEQVVSIWIP